MWASLVNWILQRVVYSGLSWLAQKTPAAISYIRELAAEYFRKRERSAKQEKALEETNKTLETETDPKKRANAYADAINSGRDNR